MKKTKNKKKPVARKPAAKSKLAVRKPQAKAAAKPRARTLSKAPAKARTPAKPAARPAETRKSAEHRPAAETPRSPTAASRPAVAPRPAATPRPAVAAAKPAAAAAPAPQTPKKLSFKVNELIVYPAHGVGRVTQIEVQEIAGVKIELYIVDFEKEKLRLKVPTERAEQKGMRRLADKSLIEQAMKVIKGRARIKRTMWSRRAQEYDAKINSGDLIAVAEVVRDLYRSDRQPEQSYSERQLFEQALERMAREVAAVRKIDDDQAIKELEDYLARNAKRGGAGDKTDEDMPAEEAA